MQILSSLNTNKPVRWCDNCVALVAEHGEEKPKDMLMLKGMEIIPLPTPQSEHMYLRDIQTVTSVVTEVNVESKEDVTYYIMSIHWDSKTCTTVNQRDLLNSMKWNVKHRFSEFVWLDKQLRSRLGKGEFFVWM